MSVREGAVLGAGLPSRGQARRPSAGSPSASRFWAPGCPLCRVCWRGPGPQDGNALSYCTIASGFPSSRLVAGTDVGPGTRGCQGGKAAPATQGCACEAKIRAKLQNSGGLSQNCPTYGALPAPGCSWLPAGRQGAAGGGTHPACRRPRRWGRPACAV